MNRRRALLIVTAGAALGMASLPLMAQAGDDHKTTICHNIDHNPVTITIDKHGVDSAGRDHSQHIERRKDTWGPCPAPPTQPPATTVPPATNPPTAPTLPPQPTEAPPAPTAPPETFPDGTAAPTTTWVDVAVTLAPLNPPPQQPNAAPGEECIGLCLPTTE